MKNKLIKIADFFLPIIVWGALWQIVAMIINHPFLLPSVPKTFGALLKILSSKVFLKTVLYSILRVLSGLVIGTIAGFILAVLAHHVHVVYVIFAPLISVIKATPIATVIILLWLLFNGDILVFFIAVLMILPIVWQNVLDAYDSISATLTEVCEVYEIPLIKRMKILILPSLFRYLIPAIITSTGLAWKAVISAEIIAYVKNSIGQLINDAKSAFDTATVFAWTLIVIVFSLILEKVTKYLLKRYNP